MSLASPIKAFFTCSPGSMLFIITQPIESKASGKGKAKMMMVNGKISKSLTCQRHHERFEAGDVFVQVQNQQSPQAGVENASASRVGHVAGSEE